MPLSEKARIEAYLPDLPRHAYRNLLEALDQEFTYTFGGCTTMRGLHGSYLSRLGVRMQDRISLIYTDAPFAFEENLATLSRYADELREAAFEALEEEVVLVPCSRCIMPCESSARSNCHQRSASLPRPCRGKRPRRKSK